MANVYFSVPVTDQDGSVSSYSGYGVFAGEVATDTRVQAIMDAVDPLIQGVQGNANITRVFVPNRAGLRAAPLPQSDREIKGKFTFATAGGYSKLISLPTFNRTLTVAGGNIDTVNATVAAFVTEILDNAYSDNRFVDLTQLVRALEAFGI